MRNKWGPLRVHRMNWKFRFRELTGWRPKNDEERRKIFAKSPTETSRKRYGSGSAWIFFTETIFLTNFKWFSDTRRVDRFCSSLLPLFIGKRGEACHPAHPGELGCFLQKAPLSVPGPSRLGCYLHPLFTKYTPCLFFADSFSVTLRNFTNYVTILVFFP